MKHLLFTALIAVGILSCSKDKTVSGNNDLPGIANATVKLNGMFTPTPGIAVMGEARMVSDGTAFAVLLQNFQVSSGPDLKVYLSKKDSPFEFINLGPLQSNSGNQVYKVPAGTNFSLYKYVLIHCQQYNHLFAIAELKP